MLDQFIYSNHNLVELNIKMTIFTKEKCQNIVPKHAFHNMYQLTKGLPKVQFNRMTSKLKMEDIFIPT